MLEKDQLVRLIRALYDDMKSVTLQAGVSEDKYQKLLEFVEETEDVEILREIHTWITEIRTSLFDNVLKVWERHTPETWRMYELMEVFDLAEQKLLRQYNRLLRDAWRKIPHVKKKRKPSQPDAAETAGGELCVRSEGKRSDGNRGGDSGSSLPPE